MADLEEIQELVEQEEVELLEHEHEFENKDLFNAEVNGFFRFK
jgi:hypothetical protein